MVRNTQKCKFIIDKYGKPSEKEVASELLATFWEYKQNREAYLALQKIYYDYVIKTANEIKSRFVDPKDDWFCEDDELTIYSIDDCEWWVTDTLENLKKEYHNITGENPDDCTFEEVAIDKDGMFYDFKQQPEIETMIKIILNGEKQKKTYESGEEQEFSYMDSYCMFLPFNRVMELDGDFKHFEKPYMIATTEI